MTIIQSICYNLRMNRHESVRRATDFLLGKKIEGTVAAVLRRPEDLSQRYVVNTGKELLAIKVYPYHTLTPLIPVYFPRPTLKRGDIFNERIRNVAPWVEGQNI